VERKRKGKRDKDGIRKEVERGLSVCVRERGLIVSKGRGEIFRRWRRKGQ